MRRGSLAIFHEYGHYETWHFFPRLANQERFREHVIATWRESGGEPDGAVPLATLLPANGLQFARLDRTCFVFVRKIICGNGLLHSSRFIFPV
jgi:hypothetical protein